MYNIKILTEADYKQFENIYDDFCKKARAEYNFELPPIDYIGFIESIKKDLIKCLILFDEEGMIQAFLVYTTAISEAIELNIIHCKKRDKQIEYSKGLLKKFLEMTKIVRRSKVVCYPMLGEQRSLIGVIAKLGFQFVGIEVLRFVMHGTPSQELFTKARVVKLPPFYDVTSWNDSYFDAAVDIIQEAFQDSSDALFDPRFKTLRGTKDIISKVVNNVYAEFKPNATSVLLYKGEPVGFSFMNITNKEIVNIPLVGIKQAHQGKGLSTIMLKHSMDIVLQEVNLYNIPIKEVNTTTETNNLQALRLYKNLGFIEDYNYPQAYLPIQG